MRVYRTIGLLVSVVSGQSHTFMGNGKYYWGAKICCLRTLHMKVSIFYHWAIRLPFRENLEQHIENGEWKKNQNQITCLLRVPVFASP